MYRPEAAGSRPEGFVTFALDRLGVLLEIQWRTFSLRRRVASALQESGGEVVKEIQHDYPGRGERQNWVSSDHLALGIARWDFSTGRKPSVETVAAALAAASGAIGNMAEPDEGNASVLAALFMALRGARVLIVVASVTEEKKLTGLLQQIWGDTISVPIPEVISLVDLAEQHRPLHFVGSAPRIVLHDVGEVLAHTGDRLLITTGPQDLGITEFTRRALLWGESAMEGEDFHFDSALGVITLSDTFLSRLSLEAENSFGSWKNVRLREEAARAGILALHCLQMDSDIRLDGERIIPLTQAAGNIIADAGARMEAVLAARYGLDPKPLADQHIRRFREMLASHEIAGGVSVNDRLLASFFFRSTGLVTLSMAGKREKVFPGRYDFTQMVDVEAHVDFREPDSVSCNAESLFREFQAGSLLRVTGMPTSLRFLLALDSQAHRGVIVEWNLDSSYVVEGRFSRRILAFLPNWVSVRVLRMLSQWQLSARESSRCKRLEDGLLSQQKIGNLLAINSSEYAA